MDSVFQDSTKTEESSVTCMKKISCFRTIGIIELEFLSILQYSEVHSDRLLKSPINKDPMGE
jgi:hypothetical protein